MIYKIVVKLIVLNLSRYFFVIRYFEFMGLGSGLELKLLSWDKCYNNLLRLQRRIFKSVLVGDTISVCKLQNLVLTSNSARLLAIRLVTQINKDDGIDKINKNSFFSLKERFFLNFILKKNVFNWKPSKFEKFVYLTKESLSIEVTVPSLVDRCWQILVQFALEPAHRSIFSPRSLDITSSRSDFRLHYLLYLNLQYSSFGYQKRVLIIDFFRCLSLFNVNNLLKKLICSKDLKFSLFLSFLLGFNFNFVVVPELEKYFSLPFFLLNVLFHGLEYYYDGIRYGYRTLAFLLPIQDEISLFKNLCKFIVNIGLDISKSKVEVYSVYSGFDFLTWNFKVINKCCVIRPSFDSFNSFFRRVKNIITNSNYGAVCF